MKSNEIRQSFFDFFKSKSHQIVESAPIVIKEDPTLMFTNAGMNQFKDIFVGDRKSSFSRVANTQKCLRVSGKHNDLEEVGVDHYHHTMFEMLGNWSFGDYFKKEAIAWSWEFLTEVLKIEKERLYVTVFEGNEQENIPFDQESQTIWEQFVPKSHIIKGNKKDNFWEMGDTGPCGPCTEIHYDARSDEERVSEDGAFLVNKDNAEVIEIWNNVFIQFNRTSDGKLHNLPAQHVDTGMGLERLVRVMQHKSSNYDTDLFTPILDKIETISGIKYGYSDGKADIAFRVIADHIRAITFTIVDGQLPSSTGAGYVVRRILRRAVRFGFSFLDLKKPFLFQLVPVIMQQFKGVFKDIETQQSFIAKVIEEEEKSFLQTLSKGLEILNSYFENTISKQVDGKTAFDLLDTFGFPIDLTQLIALDAGFKVDISEFERHLEAQKLRSRKDGKKEMGDWIAVYEGDASFVGYDVLAQSDVKILRYRAVNQKDETLYQIVLDKTPFYGESGGQVGDTGVLQFADGSEIEIIDTVKEQQLHLHIAEQIPQNLKQPLVAKVNQTRRSNISVHHSATHLMHAALQKVLGVHVAQKGSLVNENILRFDFSHFAKMTEEELQEVSAMVNQKIQDAIPLQEERNVPFEEAKSKGAMALFGEKYADKVRVITFENGFSSELCGGTHVQNTANIGLFKITAETASAAGIRRIEAKAGMAALHYLEGKELQLNELLQALNNPKNALDAIEKNKQLLAEMETKLAVFEKQQAGKIRENMETAFKSIGGYEYLVFDAGEIAPDELKNILFSLKNQKPKSVGLVGSISNDKPMLSAFCGDELLKDKSVNCGNIIKETAKYIQGGGGGQPFYATAGGKDKAGIEAALSAGTETILSLL